MREITVVDQFMRDSAPREVSIMVRGASLAPVKGGTGAWLARCVDARVRLRGMRKARHVHVCACK